jgi:hypothetical protein
MIMHDLSLLQERRGLRGHHNLRAITLQLEHITKLHDLRCLTLSDAAGHLLATSGDHDEAEALSNYAPLLAQCTDRGRRAEIIRSLSEHVPSATDESVLVRSFYLDGQRYQLAVIGHTSAQLDAALHRALSGTRRIYRQTLLAA